MEKKAEEKKGESEVEIDKEEEVEEEEKEEEEKKCKIMSVSSFTFGCLENIIDKFINQDDAHTSFWEYNQF